MGYLVGLHTAGIVPRRLAAALPLVDWVAMDAKARFADHERVTRVPGSGRRARLSADLIRASGVACQLHTIAAEPGAARGARLQRRADAALNAGSGSTSPAS
jgi:pyruvate formate lyase activating enzyme